jgi:ABC-type branched-subunit amino acid transport system ATPase component
VTRSLTVQIGGVRALDGLSLTIEPGISGLVGPNGAGKTTFLNVLSGFVKPLTGSVTYDGADLLGMPPHKRARWGLRRTFQQEQLALGLSAADNVLATAENIGAGRREAAGALAAVGLTGADRPAAELSMLERRLLELAQVMVGSPRLIVLDEPGAGLSEAETEVLVPVIRTIAARTGVSVVLVDHDMDFVSALCVQLAVLDFGLLIANGPTAEVLTDPVVRRAYLGDEEL